jgi:DNA-binding XRE family transcriptional regulator
MSAPKDPIGYPGDEAVLKAFGQTLKNIRLERGLTTDQAEALLREQIATGDTRDRFRHIGRALGIHVRRTRESKGMTRVQLAGNSGLPVRFIISVERGKVKNGGELCHLVRLAYGLKLPLEQFFQDLSDLNDELAVSQQ